MGTSKIRNVLSVPTYIQNEGTLNKKDTFVFAPPRPMYDIDATSPRRLMYDMVESILLYLK